MSSSYPLGYDAFGTPAPNDLLITPIGGRTHSQSHGDLGDAIEAIQAELGLQPRGSAASVAARLASLPVLTVAQTWTAVQTHGQAIILDNGTADSPEIGWQSTVGADWKADCFSGLLRFMRHAPAGGSFVAVALALTVDDLVYAPFGLAVGANALLGAERMRVSGGSAAVAGSTDVVFGAGQVSAGGAIRSRGGMFSGDSTGIVVSAAATWTTVCPTFGGLLVLRDGTSGGVCVLMHDVGVSTVTILANSIGGTLSFQVSAGNLQVQIASGTFPRTLRTVRLVAAEF